jgi:hypothetical protein
VSDPVSPQIPALDSDPAAPPAAPPASRGPADVMAWRRIRNGAGWLYAIAGFSVVNFIAWVASLHFRMLIGLGITYLSTIVFWDAGAVGTAIAIVAIVAGAAGFLLLAIFARRGSRVAYLIAIIVYALDTLLLVWLSDWTGAAFHGLGLIFIVQGLVAARTKPDPALAAQAAVPAATTSTPRVSRAIGYGMLGVAGLFAAGFLFLVISEPRLLLPQGGDASGLGFAGFILFAGVCLVGIPTYVGLRFLRDAKKAEATNAVTP